MSVDNQTYVQKLLEMKMEMAEAFNNANKVYQEAQRIKAEVTKKQQLEEEKAHQMFSGAKDLDLDKFIKPEYLKAALPYQDIKVPGKVEHKISAHKPEVTCLAFNGVGDAIATGGADSLVRVWQAENGKEVQSLKGLARSVTDVSFSMDNEYLAAASTEHKVLLWRLKTMRVAQTFTGHKETINACKFAFVTKSLITGSQDRSLKVFDVDRGTTTKTVSARPSHPYRSCASRRASTCTCRCRRTTSRRPTSTGPSACGRSAAGTLFTS